MSYLRSYHEILAAIDGVDPVAYARTRNHLDGAVTRLSPYISRGIISLPFIRDRLLKQHPPAAGEKLMQELAWREYFQNVWWDRGDDIFSNIRFPRDDWRHTELVSALANAETGITVIDDAVKTLYETGYMHNHARMWVASLACNLVRAHWFPMGQWLYAHLIDGDLASNFLSWQWVAGTSVNKRYTLNQSLIDACSGGDPQANTFLAIERDDLLTLDPPRELLFTEAFTLTTEYPDVSPVPTVAGADVLLYTPWTLDPTWRAAESARRILVIDPAWFDRFPVSDLVMDFIVRQGETVIPDLEVHVGSMEDLFGWADAASVCAQAHQTNRTWPVRFDPVERLFPEVAGYYPSFFKYWQAVQQVYR